jgi:hypothetical protein
MDGIDEVIRNIPELIVDKSNGGWFWDFGDYESDSVFETKSGALSDFIQFLLSDFLDR